MMKKVAADIGAINSKPGSGACIIPVTVWCQITGANFWSRI